jgi:hypothetical protein
MLSFVIVADLHTGSTLLSNNLVSILEYEMLTRQWPQEIERVQKFLNVDALPLTPGKEKQETRALSQVIEKFEEVWRALEIEA